MKYMVSYGIQTQALRETEFVLCYIAIMIDRLVF